MSSSLRPFNDHRWVPRKYTIFAALCLLPFYNFPSLNYPRIPTFTSSFFPIFSFVIVSVVYPGVSTSSVLDVWTTRYDQWVEQVPAGLLPPRMNVLVVDVQGMDLEVGVGLREKSPRANSAHTC